jgi:hypothetical protein
MKLSRDQFLDRFAISIGVHSIPLWSRRSKEPPLHVSRSVWEVVNVNGGKLPLPNSAAFAEIVHPVIRELHARLPTGERPSPRELSELIYEALDRAGIEVILRPPLTAGGRQR